MSSHVMSVERILLHSVKECDFLVLLWCKISNRMISHSILELNLFHYVLSMEFLIGRYLANLTLIVEPTWCFRVKFFIKAILPVEISVV